MIITFNKIMDPVILDPVIPYVGPFGGGCFSSKKLVKLEGAIPPHAYGFDINLLCGPKTYPHDDIALQISTRFLNGYISFNSSEKGIWGKEIRMTNVPMEADQKFKISVLCEVNQYKVAINDEHYCIFPQRIPCEKVSHLSIDGDVSITRISYKSMSNSISDCTTPFAPTLNQFDNVQHSDLPPSYDTAMNNSEDIESQNERLACISIFHFRYNRAPLKAILKNGCKTFYIFLCIIAVAIVLGYIIFLIAKYRNNFTGDTSYSAYGISSIDFKAFNEDLEKEFKVIQDGMESKKEMDEQIHESNNVLANAKKLEEDMKYLPDLEVKNDKVINDILGNSMKMDESNTFVYEFVQSPVLIDQVSKEINDLLAKEKQN